MTEEPRYGSFEELESELEGSGLTKQEVVELLGRERWAKKRQIEEVLGVYVGNQLQDLQQESMVVTYPGLAEPGARWYVLNVQGYLPEVHPEAGETK
jgi:hypothetical protein